MKTGIRLVLYGLGLVVAFAGAFGIAGAVVPDDARAGWMEGSEMNGHNMDHDSVKGLSIENNGYMLSPIEAPLVVGEPGELKFQIRDASGAPLNKYTKSHEKDLHLIVVRSDGSQFRHVHPLLDEATGAWSMPWEWSAAGTYRMYADFVPAGEDASSLTLTRTVHVSGEFASVMLQPARVAQVDGFTVTIDGDLAAGSTGELTITVERHGEPVTTLEPYLGAFGHLVALRDGDLAYLHIHAEGEVPQSGETAGPNIVFAANAPTAGRYLLYLDFQVNGEVHTAEFVLDAAHNDGTTGIENGSHSDEH